MQLSKLNNNELDIVLIEGVFDKNKYDSRLFRKEPFVGICSINHPFANREIPLEEIFNQDLIIREEGSGTRFIFEQELLLNNYSIKSFKKVHCVSSFELIKKIVKNHLGITFAYKSIINDDKDLTTFTINNNNILREFNYVCLKQTKIDEMVEILNTV